MKKKTICLIIISCIVLNYLNIIIVTSEKTDLDYKEFEKNKTTVLGQTEYKMIIISPSTFSKELQDLIIHKKNHGINTLLMTTEEIYSGYSGFDKPEQIKYFIKDAIETHNTSYILLLGNIDKVPTRYSAVKCSYYTFEYVPTDQYYADIYDENGSFCSWDSNNNTIFGEFWWEMDENIVEYIDFVDLYPDVGIGRLPCKNKKEVEIVVRKIIDYETSTYGKEWFNKIILMGGDTHPQYEGFEGEMVTEHIGELMSGFKQIKIWTSNHTFRPLIINLIISMGAGFVSYSGHGLEYGISTNPPNKDRGIYYLSPYLRGLFNGNKLPIIFFDCCSTGTIDRSFFGLRLPCFAWSWVKKPSGGAIATIGASRMGYSGYVGDILGAGTCRMNANFFGSYKPGVTLSDMLIEAQIRYLDEVWKDCFTIEEYNLIGDPSLKVGGYG
jgi:hypothetical protein